MRLHHLSIQAFGPFGGRVEADLDALGEAGLFLLTGPTGAGKSSVLDAISFALYGVVPGVRQAAKHPRSDHASPGVAPEIALEFSVGARRFRSRRNPAWERPKKRGSGTTTQQAGVVIEEEGPDGWRVLANRLDEAGLLVTELLAMSADQFHQVAMLPQGEFASFLQASSTERHAVLERLFRTDRFSRVEAWLVDRRKSLRETNRAHQDHAGDLVGRLLEATGSDLPDAWDLHNLSSLVRSGAIAPWAESVAAATAAAQAKAALRADEAAALWADADRAHQDAARVAEILDRAAVADRTLAALEADADTWSRRERQLTAHRAAATAVHLVAERDEIDSHATVLQDQRSLLAEPWGLAQAASTEICQRHAEVGRRVHQLESLVEVASQLGDLQRQASDAATALAKAASDRDALVAAAKSLPDEISCHRGQLVELRALAAGVEAQRESVARATRCLSAAIELRAANTRLAVAETAAQSATEAALQHREVLLDLRERRIEGMAGELASQLAAGCACPVCGSAAHPSPAHATATLERSDEDAARKQLDSSEVARSVALEELAALRSQVSALSAVTEGLDHHHWQSQVASAEAAAARAESAARAVLDLQRTIDRLVARENRLRADIDACHGRIRIHESDSATAVASAHALRTRVAEAVPEAFTPDVDAEHLVVTSLESERANLAKLASLIELDRSIAAARADVSRLSQSADSAALSHGFPDADRAVSARLDEDQAQAWTRALDERHRARERALAMLEDPAVEESRHLPAVDLEALTAARTRASAARDEATAAAARATVAGERAGELATGLHEAVAAWLPDLESLDVAISLSQLTEGTSADNAWRMRLSAYVLAERLRRVVDAANDRLVRMGSGRFQLEHSDARGAGEHRGGLSLRARDDWTGTTRDPVTLSGGETFLVSLALALGLADTVSQESGGIRIDTLFIDEGFGSLDADTLEEVMDTLDSLREGGRTIGVVSHVAEMRERITTQLAVTGGPQGSTLRAHGLGVA